MILLHKVHISPPIKRLIKLHWHQLFLVPFLDHILNYFVLVYQTFTVLLSSSMMLDIPSFLTSLRAACFSFSMAAAAFMAATTDIKAGFCGAAAGAAAAKAGLAPAGAGAVEPLLDGSIIADVDVVLEGSFALFEAVEANAEAAEAVGALVPGAAAVALVAAFPAAAATSAGFLSAVSRVNASKIGR